MRKEVVPFAAAWGALLFLLGCQAVRKEAYHWRAGMVGLPRQVTLFSCSGDTLGVWRGRFMVEVDSGVVSWIGEDGRERKVTGTVVVEQMGEK